MSTTNTTTTLKDLMSANTNVTLAKLAEATNAPYAAIRAKAKQPIQGVAYDSEAINYEAIEAYLLKRNPELKLAELPWAELNTKTERATKSVKDSDVDFSVGKSYYLRYFKSVWTIVYVTETHLAMITEGSTVPKVLAKTTFIACGVKPADYKPETKEQEEA